jgi:hypothetical protein
MVALMCEISHAAHGGTATSGPGPPNFEASQSHSDTPDSVELLWTSDQPAAETST